MERILTAAQHLVFVNLTSYLAIAGGLLLVAGFILIGLILRRFERAFGTATHWQFHFVAPLGLLAYLLLQAVASLRHQNMGAIEQWTGYTLLSWSAFMCLWGVLHFLRILKKLAKVS